MTRPEVFPTFPEGLVRITSPATPTYNCIAWAAGDWERWWWPDSMGIGYWPEDIPREETIPAFVSAFATLGFTPVSNPYPEPGIEKLALFARGDVPTHIARQLPVGKWTSTLGGAEDVEHPLDSLAGGVYGDVVLILGRTRERPAHSHLSNHHARARNAPPNASRAPQAPATTAMFGVGLSSSCW